MKTITSVAFLPKCLKITNVLKNINLYNGNNQYKKYIIGELIKKIEGNEYSIDEYNQIRSLVINFIKSDDNFIVEILKSVFSCDLSNLNEYINEIYLFENESKLFIGKTARSIVNEYKDMDYDIVLSLFKDENIINEFYNNFDNRFIRYSESMPEIYNIYRKNILDNLKDYVRCGYNIYRRKIYEESVPNKYMNERLRKGRDAHLAYEKGIKR